MQNKFAKKDALTERVEDGIKKEKKRRDSVKNIELFHPSQLTECTRKSIYRVYGEPYELDVFEAEHQKYAKQKWLDFFETSRIAKLIDTDIDAADTTYNLASRVDGILRIGELTFVILIKSLSTEEFQRIKEQEIHRRDIVELILDMWLVEVHHGLLLYEDRTTNEITTFHILPYPSIINAACRKCRELYDNKIKGIIPERPYDSPDSKECLTCNFKETCWNREQ